MARVFSGWTVDGHRFRCFGYLSFKQLVHARITRVLDLFGVPFDQQLLTFVRTKITCVRDRLRRIGRQCLQQVQQMPMHALDRGRRKQVFRVLERNRKPIGVFVHFER